MSYIMRVIFRCNGCGLEITTNTLGVPPGWLQPAGLSQAAGPHLCQECVQRRMSPPAHLVPVSIEIQ